MIVVADTGPLNYLILLDQTELLHRFYGRVVIPEAVFRELRSRTAPQPRRSLQVSGTLGIIRAAAEEGLINVPEILARLRDTSFYVDEDLISSVFGEWLAE